MKKLIMTLAMLAAGADLQAQQAGSFGAGVVAGDPTGLALKYWFDNVRAMDAGVGFSGDAALYADLLWHGWDMFPQPEKGKLGAYVGVGPRIETNRDTALGIRTMGGVDYWFEGHPIELFFEAGPVFRLTPDRNVDVHGGIGVRFYFGGPRPRSKAAEPPE